MWMKKKKRERKSKMHWQSRKVHAVKTGQGGYKDRVKGKWEEGKRKLEVDRETNR